MLMVINVLHIWNQKRSKTLMGFWPIILFPPLSDDASVILLFSGLNVWGIISGLQKSKPLEGSRDIQNSLCHLDMADTQIHNSTSFQSEAVGMAGEANLKVQILPLPKAEWFWKQCPATRRERVYTYNPERTKSWANCNSDQSHYCIKKMVNEE